MTLRLRSIRQSSTPDNTRSSTRRTLPEPYSRSTQRKWARPRPNWRQQLESPLAGFACPATTPDGVRCHRNGAPPGRRSPRASITQATGPHLTTMGSMGLKRHGPATCQRNPTEGSPTPPERSLDVSETATPSGKDLTPRFPIPCTFHHPLNWDWVGLTNRHNTAGFPACNRRRQPSAPNFG